MRTYSSHAISRSIIVGLAAAFISTGALAATVAPTHERFPHNPNRGNVGMGVDPAGDAPVDPAAKVADRCSVLEMQFDRAVAMHGNAAKVEAARTLRGSGAAECDSGHSTTGIRNLTQALKDIGVKAQA